MLLKQTATPLLGEILKELAGIKLSLKKIEEKKQELIITCNNNDDYKVKFIIFNYKKIIIIISYANTKIDTALNSKAIL